MMKDQNVQLFLKIMKMTGLLHLQEKRVQRERNLRFLSTEELREYMMIKSLFMKS